MKFRLLEDRLDCGRELCAFAEECIDAAKNAMERMLHSIAEERGLVPSLERKRENIERRIRLLEELDRCTFGEICYSSESFRREMKEYRRLLSHPERHSRGLLRDKEERVRAAYDKLADARDARESIREKECGRDTFGHFIEVSLAPYIRQVEMEIDILKDCSLSLSRDAFEALREMFGDDRRLHICVYAFLSVLNMVTRREFFRSSRFGYSERMEFLDVVKRNFPMSLYDRFEPFHLLLKGDRRRIVDGAMLDEAWKVFVAFTKKRFRFASLIAFSEHLKRRDALDRQCDMCELPYEAIGGGIREIEEETLSLMMRKHLRKGLLGDSELLSLCEHLLSHLGDLEGYLTATTCPEKFLIPAGVNKRLDVVELGEVSEAMRSAVLEILKLNF